MKILILFLSISFTAQASQFEPTHYQGEKEEVRDVFNSLWSNFKTFDNSHCYRRAHVLSWQMSLENINTMKVFWFRGNKLKLSWWYHVAPMVYHKNEGVVLDRGLSSGATYLTDWLESLSKGKKCIEVFSMEEYRQKKSSEYCLYLIAPMYYYGPKSLENFDRNEFMESDLKDMLFSIGSLARSRYLKENPLP